MELVSELKSTIISFHPDQLKDVRKTLGYDEIKLIQDIEHFDGWIRLQNHFKLKDFDREFLERFLIYCKGSIERAKQRFDKFCTFHHLMPEFLVGFDIRNEFVHVHETTYTCLMPTPTPDNYRLMIACTSGNQNEEWNLTQYFRYMIVMCEYMLYNDYCLGYEMILDPRKMSLSFVKKLNPVVIHKALTLVVEALGQRVKKIHLISSDNFFDTILMIIKAGLTSKLANRLVVHNSLDSLHKLVPKSILPEDLGGDDRTIKEISCN